MLHTKFHENRPAGSGEEDFRVVFTIIICATFSVCFLVSKNEISSSSFESCIPRHRL